MPTVRKRKQPNQSISSSDSDASSESVESEEEEEEVNLASLKYKDLKRNYDKLREDYAQIEEQLKMPRTVDCSKSKGISTVTTYRDIVTTAAMRSFARCNASILRELKVYVEEFVFPLVRPLLKLIAPCPPPA